MPSSVLFVQFVAPVGPVVVRGRLVSSITLPQLVVAFHAVEVTGYRVAPWDSR